MGKTRSGDIRFPIPQEMILLEQALDKRETHLEVSKIENGIYFLIIHSKEASEVVNVLITK